jgi:hypothetical protein
LRILSGAARTGSEPESPYTAAMLDAGLRVTFRHFWTLFFIAAVVTVPLHLIFVFSWHGVVGLRELAPQIQELPPGRQVHFVGASDIEHARIALWVLDLVELALVPFALRAARAAIAADERGEVPTALGGWRGAFGRKERLLPSLHAWLLGALLVGVVVGVLLDGVGRMLAEPWGPNWSYVILGLTQGCARAAGAAFFLGPVAANSQPRSASKLSHGVLP